MADFDFSGGLDEVISSKFEDSVTLNPADDGRSPTESVIRSIKEEALDTLTNPSQIAEVGRLLLPRNAADAIRSIEQSKAAFKRNHAGEVSSLLKGVDKLTKVIDSSSNNATIRKLTSRLRRSLDIKEDKSSTSRRAVSRQETIDEKLSTVFNKLGTQLDENLLKQRVASAIEEAKTTTRFEAIIPSITRMDYNLERLYLYQDQVTQKYQRTALKLKYQSLYVMKDLLANAMTHNKIFRTQFEAIVKNTALPDSRKRTLTDISLGNIDQSIAGTANSYLDRFKRNIGTKVTLGINKARVASQSGFDAVDAIDAVPGVSKLSIISGQAGTIRDAALDFATGRARSSLFEEGGKANAVGNVFRRIPSALGDLLENSENEGGIKGKIASSILNIVRPSDNVGRSLNNTSLDPTTDAIFDGRTHTSINVVIPGLLGKIVQEQRIARTGKASSAPVYVAAAGKFFDSEEIDSSIENSINNAVKSGGIEDNVTAVMDIIASKVEMTSETLEATQKLVRATIATNQVEGNPFTNITDIIKMVEGASLDSIDEDQRENVSNVVLTAKEEFTAQDETIILNALSNPLDTGTATADVISNLINIYGATPLISAGIIKKAGTGYYISKEYLLRTLSKETRSSSVPKGDVLDPDGNAIDGSDPTPDDDGGGTGGSTFGNIRTFFTDLINKDKKIDVEDQDGDGIEDNSFLDILNRRKARRAKNTSSVDKDGKGIDNESSSGTSFFSIASIASGAMSLMGGGLSLAGSLIGIIGSLGMGAFNLLGTLGIGALGKKLLGGLGSFKRFPIIGKLASSLGSILSLTNMTGKVGSLLSAGALAYDATSIFGGEGDKNKKKDNKKKGDKNKKDNKKSRTKPAVKNRRIPRVGKLGKILGGLAALGIGASVFAGDDDSPDSEGQSVTDTQDDVESEDSSVVDQVKGGAKTALRGVAKGVNFAKGVHEDLRDEYPSLRFYEDVVDKPLAIAAVALEVSGVRKAALNVVRDSLTPSAKVVSKVISSTRDKLRTRGSRKLLEYLMASGVPEIRQAAPSIVGALSGGQTATVNLIRRLNFLPKSVGMGLMNALFKTYLFALRHPKLTQAVIQTGKTVGKGASLIKSGFLGVFRIILKVFPLLTVIDAGRIGWWIGELINDEMAEHNIYPGIELYNFLEEAGFHDDQLSLLDKGTNIAKSTAPVAANFVPGVALARDAVRTAKLAKDNLDTNRLLSFMPGGNVVRSALTSFDHFKDDSRKTEVPDYSAYVPNPAPLPSKGDLKGTYFNAFDTGDDGGQSDSTGRSERTEQLTYSQARSTVVDLVGQGGLDYVELKKGVKLQGLHPVFLKIVLSMARDYFKATGKKLLINDGYRTAQDQQDRINKYNTNGKKRAAPVGSSMHEFGLAIDINTSVCNKLDKLGLFAKYGLLRPIGRETWHVESIGVQFNRSKAKRSPAYAGKMMLEALGRGGGGPRGVTNGRSLTVVNSIWKKGKQITVGKESEVASTRAQVTGDITPVASPVITAPTPTVIVPPRTSTVPQQSPLGSLDEVNALAEDGTPNSVVPTNSEAKGARETVGVLNKQLTASERSHNVLVGIHNILAEQHAEQKRLADNLKLPEAKKPEPVPLVDNTTIPDSFGIS